MKKQVLFLAAMMCMMHAVSTFARDRIITVEQLPAAAKTFVNDTFSGHSISYAKVETDFLKKTYEVRLDNGTKIEFDKNGTFDKLDCGINAVPAKLIPATIANYVKTNYPKTKITKIDKERYGYEVELSNDLDLKFNHEGVLIDIDD